MTRTTLRSTGPRWDRPESAEQKPGQQEMREFAGLLTGEGAQRLPGVAAGRQIWPGYGPALPPPPRRVRRTANSGGIRMRRPLLIAPSILAADFGKLGEEVRA